jgi:hypothetical protein
MHAEDNNSDAGDTDYKRAVCRNNEPKDGLGRMEGMIHSQGCHPA